MQSNYRLLVVRLGAMGDILHALPAVTALRKAHPDWTIDWVVEPGWSPLLASAKSAGRSSAPDSTQPVVDRLHLAASKRWRKSPLSRTTYTEIRELWRTLRAARYDAVLDMQGLIRSALIGRMSNSARRIGFAETRERPARWLLTEPTPTTKSAHMIDQQTELASALEGSPLEPQQPLLPFDPEAEAWAARVLPAGSPPAVLINPGAGWGSKRWPQERYSAVARQLASAGMKILVNAGPGEEVLAETVARPSAGAARVIRCSVAQLIAITRRVSLVVAGDTGPLHLGCSLGVPVVGVYGPTDPARNGPYGVECKVLRSPESHRDYKRREEPEAGLKTISSEDVVAAALSLLYSGQTS